MKNLTNIINKCIDRVDYCIARVLYYDRLVYEKNIDRHTNQYVALASFKDRRIIGHGKTPSDALREAEKKGVKDPVLFYVFNPKEKQVYSLN